MRHDRYVEVAWAWRVPSGFVGVFWTRGGDGHEIGVYSTGASEAPSVDGSACPKVAACHFTSPASVDSYVRTALGPR